MWKPLVGYEQYYQISSEGEIKSVARLVKNGPNSTMIKPEKILKQQKNKNGYLQVTLCVDNIKKVEYVHRLVALTFLPNPNNLPTINHKDGVKTNNCVTNLEFATYCENNQHAYDTGLHGKNEKHYLARLSKENVADIRRSGKCGTYAAIAEKYGVSKATVRDVLLGKTWKNI